MAPVMTTATAASRTWAQVAHTDASSGKPAALVPGERGSKACPCRGEVLVVLGHYGWILVKEAIDHEAAQRHGAGRVYFATQDVQRGTRLQPGDTVGFYLYADHQGLGAEGCAAAPLGLDATSFPALGARPRAAPRKEPSHAGLRPEAPAFQPSAEESPTAGRRPASHEWSVDAPEFQPSPAASATGDPVSKKPVSAMRPDAPVFQRWLVSLPLRFNPAWLEDDSDSDSDGSGADADESDGGDTAEGQETPRAPSPSPQPSGVCCTSKDLNAAPGAFAWPARRPRWAASADDDTSAGESGSGSEGDGPAPWPAAPPGFRPPPGLPAPRPPPGLA